jgi:Exopolysaccharide biosynthesis protein YbjH
MKMRRATALFFLNLFIQGAHSEPNLNGETGYINMPNGRIAADSTLRLGYSFADPYVSMWSSASVLPWLELNARYVRILNGAMGAANPRWAGYGDYKDKVMSGKLLLLEETRNIPALAIGLNDVQGTGLFSSKYIALNKQFSSVDAAIGCGAGRIRGAFAGVRYTPEGFSNIAWAAEYDANYYRQDLFSTQTGVAQRQPGIAVAAEYHWAWLAAQLAYRAGKPSINLYATIPLNVKEFVAKIDEPHADRERVLRPSLVDWQQQAGYQSSLLERLQQQGFKNVKIAYSEHTIRVSLSHPRISLASRAVGRALRSIVLRAPLGTAQIELQYAVDALPFLTYRFANFEQVQQYFEGEISRKQLARTVTIQYAIPHQTFPVASAPNSAAQIYFDDSEGDFISFRRETAGSSKVRVAPGLGIYFNDPSGAFRYETFINAGLAQQVSEGIYFKGVGQLTLKQNISGVTQASNSLLPHVRTDVASYKQDGRVKLTQALFNQFFHPAPRRYARLTLGFYEEMFAGVGGQLVYYPTQSEWAAEFSVDALRQRETGGGLALRRYQTVTALAAAHYRWRAHNLTTTVRAGRFLAGDLGARMEFKRHFNSGIELGAWYTWTNGRDTTLPGSLSHPYHDKGVFLSVPLSALLSKDTQAHPTLAISPWTRDVGQMVNSPSDIYQMLEPAHRNRHDEDGLDYLGDLDDRYD